MKTFWLVFLLSLTVLNGVAQSAKTTAAFTPGNIVVYRVGDTAVLTNSRTAPVFLDEYTPTGVLVQSIPMPTTPNGINRPLTAISNAYNSGYLSLSPNGQYLLLTGYDTTVNIPGVVSTSASIVPRVIGIMDYTGAVNTSTSLRTYASGGSPTGAVTTNGTDIWCVSTATDISSRGIHYTTKGSNTSIQISADAPYLNHAINIVNNRLYISTSQASSAVRIGVVDPVLPTSAIQSITNLPDIPITNMTPRQFVFCDLNDSIPGNDVLYIANENTDEGGIHKFSLVGSTWVSNGENPSGQLLYYNGLAAKVSGSTVTLFATRAATIPTRGRQLVSLVDSSGYNAPLPINPTINILVTLPTDVLRRSFRGVSLVPVAPCLPPATPVISNISASGAVVTWLQVNGATGYEYSVTNTPSPGSTVIATNDTTDTLTGLTQGTLYYIHIRTQCGAGTFSSWTTTSFSTLAETCNPPSTPVASNITGYAAKILWTGIGATGYEYAISTDTTSPSSGATATSPLDVSGLLPATTYYVHIRSVCNASYSPWARGSFTTICPAPSTAQVNIAGVQASINWPAVNYASGYQYALITSPNPPPSATAVPIPGFQSGNLTGVTKYYVHARTDCGNSFSAWTTTSFTTGCYPPVISSVITDINIGTATIYWNKVSGATSYEYAILTHASPPAVGSMARTKDTALHITGLVPGNKYWLHIRTHCSDKGFSGWTSIEFHPSGVWVYPNPARDKVIIKLFGITDNNGTIIVSDAVGRVLRKSKLTANTTEIDMSGFAAGIYFVRYENYKGFVTKMIKL